MGSLRSIRAEVKTFREQAYWYADGFGNISPLGISPMTGGPLDACFLKVGHFLVMSSSTMQWLNIIDKFKWHSYCLETMSLLNLAWFNSRSAYYNLIRHV
jgi:hypothetical protein